MLIRSQDKMKIVDMHGMTVCAFEERNRNGEFKICAYGNNQPADAVENLGVYNSKERAIEILDAIQENYKDGLYTLDCERIVATNIVFQMPNE